MTFSLRFISSESFKNSEIKKNITATVYSWQILLTHLIKQKCLQCSQTPSTLLQTANYNQFFHERGLWSKSRTLYPWFGQTHRLFPVRLRSLLKSQFLVRVIHNDENNGRNGVQIGSLVLRPSVGVVCSNRSFQFQFVHHRSHRLNRGTGGTSWRTTTWRFWHGRTLHVLRSFKTPNFNTTNTKAR